MQRLQTFSALALLLAVFLSGCEEKNSLKTGANPGRSQSKKSVFVADSTIHFFLKTFGEDNISIYKAESLTNDSSNWKPTERDLARMKSADFVFGYSKSFDPWMENGGTGLIEIAASNSELLPEFPGAAVLNPAHAIEVAKATRDGLASQVLTDPGQQQRLDQFVQLVESKYRPLASSVNGYKNRFNSFVYTSTQLDSWVKESGVPGKKAFLNPDFALEADVLDLTLKREGADKVSFIVWGKEPVPALKKSLSNRGITSIVLEAGNDPKGDRNLLTIARANSNGLGLLYDPNAKTATRVKSDKKGTGGTDFDTVIQPFLDNYCIECHDADTGEGEIEFDLYTTMKKAEMHPDLWESAVALVEMGDMPPKKKDQPTAAEKKQFIEWTRELSEKWDSGAMGRDPGRITLRRLNKNEYNYTIRDLFGLRLRPADNFPEETGGEAGFDNNADALFLPPLLMENYVESAGIIVETVYRDPKARARYLFDRPNSAEEAVPAAKKILRTWSSRAYRKPVPKAELERLLSIYRRSMKKEKNFSTAMKMPLIAMLISPNFLYRPEEVSSGKDVFPVSDHDLANRLSYFLWSSMPDAELYKLAQSGDLSKRDVIKGQVERMLRDKRSRSLSMHFGGQWFKWEDLRSLANPDEKRFPVFTFDLRVSMYQESAAYFDFLLQNNRSILELIDSDYSFLNAQLARLYNIPGITGPELRKVTLTDKNRGGVLGMGSVLTATSLPLRSSPAKRGDWVLTEILGTPPPEPPMNVAQLPEDDRNLEFKTFRKTLEAHRDDPSCAGCHKAIDPLGFGLENFDPIGRWRTTQNGEKIDSSGELPDGRTFSSPAGLKQILLEDKDLFVRNMVGKVLAYALGRELTPYDRPVIADITRKVIADDYRIHRVFIEVAQSYPFLNRRSDQYKPTAKK